MSLPPQTVRIKRKKDEEPVDALYIEQQHQQKKRRVTDFVFTRLRENTKTKPVNRAVSNQVPKIRTTQPGEELRDEFSLGANKKAPSTTSSVGEPPSAPDNAAVDAPAPSKAAETAPRARRFHLTRQASTPSFPQSLARGISKRKRGVKPAIATFVEKSVARAPNPNRSSASKNIPPRGPPESDTKPTSAAPAVEAAAPSAPTRKRPNATPAERAWRVQHWSSPRKPNGASPRPASQAGRRTGTTIQAPASEWDYDSPALAAQLQELALQELRAGEGTDVRQHQEGHAGGGGCAQSEAASDMDEDEEEAQDDDDAEFVYDTYVREPRPTGAYPAQTQQHVLAAAGQGWEDRVVGVLVITEESQAEWETFVDDGEDSDKDYNSEEEDENAESFPGNDYPEDEVTSDAGSFAHDSDGSSDFDRVMNRSFSHDDDDDEDDDEELKEDSWKKNFVTGRTRAGRVLG